MHFLALSHDNQSQSKTKAVKVQEVELKLELTAKAADALQAADLFQGAPDIIRQRSIYYDTKAHDLEKAGLSLRVRRSGSKRIQTIKSAASASAGVFIRQEWEQKVRTDQPILNDKNPVLALLGDKVTALEPIFTVQVERRIWDQHGIEIALDRGRILAGELEMPIFEIELEKKDGDFQSLFALARQIAAIAPVHLSVLSKAQRGYRLLGSGLAPSKASSVSLIAEMTAADAFQEIALACIAHFRLNEPLIIDRHDKAALYQARLALRRLRSALSIHKAMVADDAWPVLSKELRWLAGVLGTARDLDVLIKRAKKGSLRDQLCTLREETYSKVGDMLQSDRARQLMLDLAEWSAIGPWRSAAGNQSIRESPAEKNAAVVLNRSYHKVTKGGRDLAELSDEARHELRKSAKKLRYAAEFYTALYQRKATRRRHERFLSALGDLQDQMGALNDLATAPKVLSGLGLADKPQAPHLMGEQQKAGLVKAAGKAFAAFKKAGHFWN